jgi:hypothetical protein
VKLGDRINSSKAYRVTAALSLYWPLLGIRFVRAGFRLPRVTEFREDSSFKCLKCNKEWTVFVHGSNNKVEAVDVTYARRTPVALGYDDYIRDNHTGTETMMASITVFRSSSQKFEISWEEARTIGTTKDVRLMSRYAGSEVQRKVEDELKSHLSGSSETRQGVEQILQVPIPAYSRLNIRLHWKQIWQEGQIVVQFADGTTVQIPYRSPVDLTFDQENISC